MPWPLRIDFINVSKPVAVKTVQPSKDFIRAEAIRHMAIVAMETSPSQGQGRYGIFFYGDIAQNPERYKLQPSQLRDIQQYMLLSTALRGWQMLEEDDVPIEAAANAAKMAYDWRFDTTVPKKSPFHFTDKDLNDLGVDPKVFDKLVRILSLYAVDLAQRRNLTEDWIPLVKKDVLNLDPDAPIHYAQELSVLQLKSNQPIRSIVNDLLETPTMNWRFRRRPAPQLKDLTNPPSKVREHAFDTLNSDNVVNMIATPVKQPFYMPLQHDGTPYFAEPVMPDADQLRINAHFDLETLGDIFSETPRKARAKVSELFDRFRLVNKKPERYGFLKDDLDHMQFAADFAHTMSKWRKLAPGDPEWTAMLVGWLSTDDPFSYAILDDLGIPRSHGRIFAEANAYFFLKDAAEQFKAGGPVSVDALLITSAMFDRKNHTDDGTLASIIGNKQDRIRALQRMLVDQDYNSHLRALSLDPKNPIGNLNAKFPVPADGASLKSWMPQTYARIAHKLDVMGPEPMPEQTPPPAAISARPA